MELIKHDIDTALNDRIYITPIGDIHQDARACDRKRLAETLNGRQLLYGKKHYCIGIGDFSDWILPGDHRYRQGDPLNPQQAAIIDAKVKELYELCKPFQWLSMGIGNHGYKMVSKHFTDPMERLSDMLGCPYGRYSGRLWLRMKFQSGYSTRSNILRILFHHGAWGGHASGGFTSALNWARGFPGWDVFVYGHNHISMHRAFERSELTTNGSLVESNAHVVACGTFLRSNCEGATTYSEKAGYPPTYVGCPLIVVKVCRMVPSVSVRIGDDV